MFNWKVEDMALMNEASYLFKGDERLFECELELSKEDKIAFVDSMQNGELSYLLQLIEKYNEEKDNLPKTQFGHVKTASLKAWLKKNDTKRLIDTDYKIGRITFFSIYGSRTIMNPHMSYDTYEDLVNEFFHRQLKDCLKMEKEYFTKHDEYCIAVSKLKKCVDNYRIDFGINLGLCSNSSVFVYDNEYKEKRLITLDEINLLLEKYAQLDSYINSLAAQIKIKY